MVTSVQRLNTNLLRTVSQSFKDNVFPIETSQRILELEGIEYPEPNYKNAKAYVGMPFGQIRFYDKSWVIPVYGKLVFKDKTTGKVLDRKKVLLAEVPIYTDHWSLVVEGKEYSPTKLKRLKAGIYHRIKANGEFEAFVNAAEGSGFRMHFDPETRKFVLKYGTTTVDLAPIILALDPSMKQEMLRSWGPEIVRANESNVEKNVLKLYKAMTGERTDNIDAAIHEIRNTFAATKVRPEVMKITLGKDYSNITPEVLTKSATELLRIARNEREPDQRDSLIFGEILDYEDILYDRIKAMATRIAAKASNRMNKSTKIDDFWSVDYTQFPIKSLFYQSSLIELAKQINILDMHSSLSKVTLLADLGGIQDIHAVPYESRMLDNSHYGFFDAIKTPEGDRVGITLYLAAGATKVGRDPAVYMRNVKNGKLEVVKVADLVDKVVGFPDDFVWQKNKYVPTKDKVYAIGKANKLTEVNASEVDYILPTPLAAFSHATVLIPFIQNDQPVRPSVATRHLEQALPLVHREVPYVTTHIPLKHQAQKDIITDDIVVSPPKEEFIINERYIGPLMSPVSGTVVKVTNNEIVIRDNKGELHEVNIYDNYPLNTDGAFLHAVPTVKVNDKVEQGQLLAETNFTKDGFLALGTNLHVAFIPHFADVFEDAILISDKAAEKLTSEHLYQYRAESSDETLINKKKFIAMFPSAMDKRQQDQLDDDGVIKEGTIVQPGDVLVAMLKKRVPTKEELMLKGFGKALSRPYSNNAITWDSEFPGVVERVVKDGNVVKVYVKSEEPAQIGDKLCYSKDTEVLTTEGWVPFPKLTVDHEVACVSLTHGCRPKIRFAFPKILIRDEHAGEMYHIRGDGLDLLVTGNHRVLTTKNGKAWITLPASEIPDFISTSHESLSGVYIPVSGHYGGRQKKFVQNLMEKLKKFAFMRTKVTLNTTELDSLLELLSGLEPFEASQYEIDLLQTAAALSGKFLVSVKSNTVEVKSAWLNEIEEVRRVRYQGHVYCCNVETGYIVVRRNNCVALCGNSNRHGNKGVIAKILPADEMPRTKDGTPIDIVLNPLGVAGRMTVGAFLEALLGKAAEKQGVMYSVAPFEKEVGRRIMKLVHVKGHYRTIQTEEGPKRVYVRPYSYMREYNYTEDIKKELEEQGISETEELIDPKTGKSLGQVTVGTMYFMKLAHQAEKKLAARSGGPGYHYDADMAPIGGGERSGQRIGELGLYALLAHGATSLIREAQTFRSDAEQGEVWTALRFNEPLPPPKPSFAYAKFLALLKAMGVNVEKKEDALQLLPLTDDEILRISNGELTKPSLVLRATDLRPEKGGLFDEEITGGINGEHWCLHGDSLVLTEDGHKSIREIVNTKYSGRVLSVKDDQLVYSKVVNWFEHYIPPGMAIVLKAGSKSLILSRNHKVYTPKYQPKDAEDANEVLLLEEGP